MEAAQVAAQENEALKHGALADKAHGEGASERSQAGLYDAQAQAAAQAPDQGQAPEEGLNG